MRPWMHHPPDGFGYVHGGWHGGWPLALSFLPLLLLLPLLAILVTLLWSRRHMLLDWLGVRLPATSGGSMPAVEMLRQRYARGEIDGETYRAVLDDLRASEEDGGYSVYEGAESPEFQREAEPQSFAFHPRPDVPVDWS